MHMRVKTFVGTHREAVDKQVNDWLAATKVEVRKTNVAFKALRERGWDAVTGRTTSRRAMGIAISVWYDDAALQPRCESWTFGDNPSAPVARHRRPR
jgi:hypothetical protein